MAKTESGILVDRVLLVDVVQGALCAKGFSPDDALACAEHCARALQYGVRSHAAPKLFSLLDHVLLNIDPSARFEMVSSHYGVEIWDGHFQIGIPVALAATDRAIELATALGHGSVYVWNFTHCLWGGDYQIRIAEARGREGDCFCGSYRSTAGFGNEVVPHGGKRGTLGTNPFGSVCSLGDGEDPFLFDGASSAISMGNVAVHRAVGTPVPAGSVLTKTGEPTTDANEAALLCSFGGYKGSAIGVAIELQQALLGPGLPTNRNREPGNGSYFEVHVKAYGLFRGAGHRTLAAQLQEVRQYCDAVYLENGNARMPGEMKFEFAKRFAGSSKLFLPDSLVGPYQEIAALAGQAAIDWQSFPRTEIA